MAVPAHQIAKRLNRPHITGRPLSRSSLAQPIPVRLICQPVELAQQTAVVTKENAQPLRIDNTSEPERYLRKNSASRMPSNSARF